MCSPAPSQVSQIFTKILLFVAKKFVFLRPWCTFSSKLSFWKYSIKKIRRPNKVFFLAAIIFSVKNMFWPLKKNYCGHQHVVLAEYDFFNRLPYFFQIFSMVINIGRKVPKIVFLCIFQPNTSKIHILRF